MSIHLNNENIQIYQVMLPLDQFPVINHRIIFKEALEVMGEHGLGIVCIINEEKKLLGILTDGDIRRKLLKIQKPMSAFFVDDALEHSICSPVTIQSADTLQSAVNLMGKKKIWDLPVVDHENHLLGLLHLHPIIQSLLAFDNGIKTSKK